MSCAYLAGFVAGRTYTDPGVLTVGVVEGWADTETDPTLIDWPARQARAAIPFGLVAGRPVNPREDTSIRYGRGGLGLWGENVMADAIVTAYLAGTRYLLLVRRVDGHGWALPGGSVEPGESPLEAAWRELREETGLDLADYTTVSTTGRAVYVPDPRASAEAWAVTVPSYARIHVDRLPWVVGADDAAEAAWVHADTWADLVMDLATRGDTDVFVAHHDLIIEALASTI